MADVVEPHRGQFPIQQSLRRTENQLFDDELDDVIGFLPDVDDDEMSDEDITNDLDYAGDDLDEEDAEYSLLKLENDLEKSTKFQKSNGELSETSGRLTDSYSEKERMNPKNTDNEATRLKKELETLKNRLHESGDQLAALKHQLRIERDHNLSLETRSEQWERRFRELNSTIDSEVDARFGIERRALQSRAEHFKSRIEELKKIEHDRKTQVNQLLSEVKRLKDTAKGQESKIEHLNDSIESLTSKLEISKEGLNTGLTHSIYAEVEVLRSDLEKSVRRERALRDDIAEKEESSAQLLQRLREFSELILHEQDNCSRLEAEKAELHDMLKAVKDESTQKISLAILNERKQKSIEIQKRDVAHEMKLAEVQSRLSKTTEENLQLTGQIAELEGSIRSLEEEKRKNSLALEKLEEVISLLNHHLPDTEAISDENQFSAPGHDSKRIIRFLRRSP